MRESSCGAYRRSGPAKSAWTAPWTLSSCPAATWSVPSAHPPCSCAPSAGPPSTAACAPSCPRPGEWPRRCPWAEPSLACLGHVLPRVGLTDVWTGLDGDPPPAIPRSLSPAILTPGGPAWRDGGREHVGSPPAPRPWQVWPISALPSPDAQILALGPSQHSTLAGHHRSAGAS